MIKIAEGTHVDIDKDVCELVELFQNDEGEYTSFSQPFLTHPHDLELALKDVKRDGINYYFYNNGTFAWQKDACFWDWKKHEE